MNGRKIILARNFSERAYSDWNKMGITPHEEIKIQDSDNDSLCAVVLPKDEKAKKILEILEFIARKAIDFTGTHIILLHETCLDDEKNKTIQQLLRDQDNRECKINNCKYEFFEGVTGNHATIYKKLILVKGEIRREAFYNETNVIKKEVFEAIWNEYNVKKKIIRIKFDCLSKCLPIVIDMKGLKECADGGDSTKTSKYLSIIQANKNWILPSEISLNERNCPHEGLREEIEAAINKIAFLGEIIEKSKVSKNVIGEMKNKQFNIDKWYSELGDCFE